MVAWSISILFSQYIIYCEHLLNSLIEENVNSDFSAGIPQKRSHAVINRSDSEWFLLSTCVQ